MFSQKIYDEFNLELIPLMDESVRPIDSFELARRWREALPVIAGLKSIVIVDSVTGGEDGDDIEQGDTRPYL